ncbi:MAG: hypothetical protein PHH60_01195 [Candidatus Margulisbacteria bacterium]|nr:hypothetical protein [Candidatus Margulisiibacteriota bacterium]
MVDVGTIRSVASNPVQRQAIVDLLVLDDLTGYDPDSTGPGAFIPGYEAATIMSHASHVVSEVGVSQPTEEALGNATVMQTADSQYCSQNADLEAVRSNLLQSLQSADSSYYSLLLGRLTDPESSEDLYSVVEEVRANTALNATVKQTIIDLLVIADLAGYDPDGTGPAAFVPGYEAATIMSHASQLHSYLGVSQSTEGALGNITIMTSADGQVCSQNADLEAVRTNLMASLDVQGRQVYEFLRGMLIVPDNEIDLLAALCTLDSAQAFCPNCQQVAPAQAEQGQQGVTLTITGTNFPPDPRIEFLLGDNVDPNIAVVADSYEVSEDRTTITLRVNVAEAAVVDDPATTEVENRRTIRIVSSEVAAYATVLADAFAVVTGQASLPLNCDDDIDNDMDDLIDRHAGIEDPDCAEGGAGERELTSLEEAGVWLHDRLRIRADLLGGYSSYPHLDDPLSLGQLRPAAEYLPNFGFIVGTGSREHPVVIIGREHPLAGNPLDGLELMYNATLQYMANYHLGADDTNLVDLAAGALLRLHAYSTDSHDVAFDIFGDYALDYNGYQFPNRAFWPGISNGGDAGVAFQYGYNNWLIARLSGQYEGSRFSYEAGAFPYAFDGNSHAVDLALTLDFELSELNAHAPDISVAGSYVPRTWLEVPVFSSTLGTDSSTFLTGNGGGVALELNWRHLTVDGHAVHPFLGAGYSQTNLDQFDPMRVVTLTAGVDTDQAGRFELTGVPYSDNIMLFYEGSQRGADFTWTLPWLHRFISLSGGVHEFGDQLVGGGSIMLRPLNLIPSPNHPIQEE